jgi:glycosyltransferase involved in cell wall biosynthesis
LAEAGFDWTEIRFSRRGLNPLRGIGEVLAFRRLYKSIRPDLIHHFTIKPVLLGSIAARSLGIGALVNSVTGLGYVFLERGILGGFLRWMITPLMKLALGNPQVVTIFQNRSDEGIYIEYGFVDPQQTVIIPGSGIDIDRFTPQPEPEGLPVVLMASRMLWDKGVGDLIEAASFLHKTNVRCRILLAGVSDPGNPAAIPEATLNEWSGKSQVEWIGHQDDMPKLYSSSHIVVLPSYGEGLPLSLLEGASSGRALIATDVAGCRDLIQNGVNGVLVPPRNPEALAQSIEDLLTDSKKRRKMAKAARESVERLYASSIIISSTLRVYEDVLAT